MNTKSFGQTGWVFIYELSGSEFESSCRIPLQVKCQCKISFFHNICNVYFTESDTTRKKYPVKLSAILENFYICLVLDSFHWVYVARIWILSETYFP